MSLRRMALATLLASAAFTFLVAHYSAEPALAHEPGGDVPAGDHWAIRENDGEIRIVWDEDDHTHDPNDWGEFEQTRPEEWTGSPQWRANSAEWRADPTINPCTDPAKPASLVRSHCSYVVVHYNPWEIRNTGNDRLNGSIYSSWCADISGSDPPAGGLRFNGKHVGCVNSSDPYANPFRQGDEDLVALYPDLAAANASPDQIVSRGHHHRTDNPGHHGSTARDEAHGHVAGFGAYWTGGQPHRPFFCNGTGYWANAGCNTESHETRTEHKTVMFWVWWEHAADEEPEAAEATMFEPEVSIRVVGGADDSSHGGTRFPVRFERVAGSPVGCTKSEQRTYVLSYDHGARTYSTTLRGAELKLVDVPSGLSESCAYVATFPQTPRYPITSRLELSRVIDATLDASAPGVSAEYEVPVVASTSFQSRVAITKPAGFSGTSFPVVFSPVGGTTGCTARLTRTFTGSTNGTTRNGPMLVDVPGGSDVPCEYTVTFPTDPPDDLDGLVLSTAQTVTITGGSASGRTASATYVDVDGQFEPRVTVRVEDAGGRDVSSSYPNHEFNVSFSNAPSGCSARAQAWYHVDTNRYSTRNSFLSLYLYERSNDASRRLCVYDVDWPPRSTRDGVRLELVRGTRTVSANAPAVTGVYRPQACDAAGNTEDTAYVLSHGEVRRVDSSGVRTTQSYRYTEGGAEQLVYVDQHLLNRVGETWALTWDTSAGRCHIGDAVTHRTVSLQLSGTRTLGPFTAQTTYYPPRITPFRTIDATITPTKTRVNVPPSGRTPGLPLTHPAGAVNPVHAQAWRSSVVDNTDGRIQRSEFNVTACKSETSVVRPPRQPPRRLDIAQCRGTNLIDAPPNVTPSEAALYRGSIKTPWVCPKRQHNPLVPANRSFVSIPGDVAALYDPTQPTTARHLYAWCAGSFTPVVTIEVPDDEYRITNLRTAPLIPVTFAKQNPQPAANTGCNVDVDASVTRMYVPGEKTGDAADAAVPVERRGSLVHVTDVDGNPLAPPTLDGACVYDVRYPATADGDLLLVEPVDDTDTAEREDQVAADDPATTWDERATEATYERACAAPNGFWSDEVGVSLAFADAEPEFFWGTWNPVNWRDDATRSTAFGRRPASVSFSWAAVDASFGWNSDASDCERAVRHELVVVELPPGNQRRAVEGAALIDEADRYLPVDYLGRSATLPPAAADVTNEGALVSLRLSLAACVSPPDGDANRANNEWECGLERVGWTPWLCPASSERAGRVVPTHSDDGLSTWYQADNPTLRLQMSSNPDGKPVLANQEAMAAWCERPVCDTSPDGMWRFDRPEVLSDDAGTVRQLAQTIDQA